MRDGSEGWYSRVSRCGALRNRERRLLTTERSMRRVMIIGTMSSGKRMIWKRESEVKAVAAVSLWPSAEYMMKVASVTKMGTEVKKKLSAPPSSELYLICPRWRSRSRWRERWRWQ